MYVYDRGDGLYFLKSSDPTLEQKDRENMNQKKDYSRLGISIGESLDNVVERLEMYQEVMDRKNLSQVIAYAEFEGRYLYSDSVSLDMAYLEITGDTSTDYLKKNKKKLEYTERQQVLL